MSNIILPNPPRIVLVSSRLTQTIIGELEIDAPPHYVVLRDTKYIIGWHSVGNTLGTLLSVPLPPQTRIIEGTRGRHVVTMTVEMIDVIDPEVAIRLRTLR